MWSDILKNAIFGISLKISILNEFDFLCFSSV